MKSTYHYDRHVQSRPSVYTKKIVTNNNEPFCDYRIHKRICLNDSTAYKKPQVQVASVPLQNVFGEEYVENIEFDYNKKFNKHICFTIESNELSNEKNTEKPEMVKITSSPTKQGNIKVVGLKQTDNNLRQGLDLGLQDILQRSSVIAKDLTKLMTNKVYELISKDKMPVYQTFEVLSLDIKIISLLLPLMDDKELEKQEILLESLIQEVRRKRA